MITFYPETYEADDDGIVDDMSRDCPCPHALLYDSAGKQCGAGHRTAAQAYECGVQNANGKRWFVAKWDYGDVACVFNPETDDLDELDSLDLTSSRATIVDWLREWGDVNEESLRRMTIVTIVEDVGSQPVNETPEVTADIFLDRPLHEREDCEWLEDDDGRILVPYHHPTGSGVYVMNKETFDRTFFWSDIESESVNIMEDLRRYGMHFQPGD